MTYQYWDDNIIYEYFMTYMANHRTKKLLRTKNSQSRSQN